MNCLHTHNFLCALCFSSTDHWFFKTTSAMSVLYSVHNRYITNCFITKVNMIIISRKVQLCPVSSRTQAQEGWPTSKHSVELHPHLHPSSPLLVPCWPQLYLSGLTSAPSHGQICWSASLPDSSTITFFPSPWPMFFQTLHLFTQTF